MRGEYQSGGWTTAHVCRYWWGWSWEHLRNGNASCRNGVSSGPMSRVSSPASVSDVHPGPRLPERPHPAEMRGDSMIILRLECPIDGLPLGKTVATHANEGKRICQSQSTEPWRQGRPKQ